MMINATKLRSLIQSSDVELEDIARALPKPNDGEKQAKRAESKIRNWTQGRMHPRPTAEDARAIAGVLGVDVREFARWTSTYRFARSSERKTQLLVDLIRGRDIDEASNLLRFSPKRAAVMVDKALQAAISDAEADDARLDRLVVSEARSNQGVIIKRFRPKDRGRAHPIQKRTSHITISVEEL